VQRRQYGPNCNDTPEYANLIDMLRDRIDVIGMSSNL
jgi:hypothetical protein